LEAGGRKGQEKKASTKMSAKKEHVALAGKIANSCKK
jgi:hypothetical protein